VRVDAVSRAWAVLATVPDPEVPALSICDLGIVRDVVERDGGLEVVLTPTYSGCPATEAIEHDALAALEHAGLGPASARLVRAPAWTSDWISADGRRKLREAGIAPPGLATGGTAPIRLFGRMAPSLACPRCASSATERISAFGSTACKSLYRCRDCGEPFEHFKAI
jgi:ring-1,2-phenylacetyl-CoA epoxidase subunit PaaD